jgi:hypothetical protein
MAMILCSSRLAAVRCYLRLCQIQRRDSRLAVPVILGVSASFRQFPPSVCRSAHHRFCWCFRVCALSALSAGLFSEGRRQTAHSARDEVATKRGQSACSSGNVGWAGVCRPAKGLALEAENMMSAFAVILNYLSNDLAQVK